MKDALILFDDYYYEYGIRSNQSDKFDILPALKYNIKSIPLRTIRKVHMCSSLPFKSIWITNELDHPFNYKTIILGDTGNVFNLVHYIRSRGYQDRIIVWYRNTYMSSVQVTAKSKSECEIWTFDKRDSEKYKFKYNPQFLVVDPRYEDLPITQDAYFIGNDKGRKNGLMELKKKLDRANISNSINIVGYNSKPISYEQVLKQIGQSRCIIDYQCDFQDGITLRPLEALCYHKKLITNNKDIIYSDYYSPNNIFVIGHDDYKRIHDFIYSPLDEIPKRIIDGYGIKAWLERFTKY